MVFRRSSRISGTLSFFAGLILAAGLLAGFGTARVHANTEDCDDNAVIHCGFTDASDFIKKVRANDSLNSTHQHDLQTVYAHQFITGQQLTPGDYDTFAAHAVKGTMYKDGRIVVNGQVVANDARTVGRLASYHSPGTPTYKTYQVGTKTFYSNTPSLVFASDSIPVYVLFDASGTMQFAVLTSCGNPAFGNLVKTSASCKNLTATPVSGDPRTFKFTASTNLQGNATIKKYVFNFGDGKTQTITSNFGQTITHTYANQNASYKASVTEYVSVPGNSNLQLTAVSDCMKQVTVTIPYYSCVQLSGAILDKSKMSFSFTATAKFGGGASFTAADFDFGDGKTQNGVKPAAGSSAVTVTHAYAQAKNYDAKATLHFMVNGRDATATACPASVTPTAPPAPECKPGVPVGSPACTPCQYDTTLQANDVKCVPPPPAQLPNTGAGDTIAIFAGVVAAGFLVYRQLIFRKHKAAFMAAQQGTSPALPNPFEADQPLGGAPAVQPHRRSLRRRRQL